MNTQNESLNSLRTAEKNSIRQIHINGNYLIGYARFRKSECEIYDFISPTLRILRFLEGDSDWSVNDRVCRFRAGDMVLLSNVCRRNIRQVYSGYLRYEMFDFYPAVFPNHRLADAFYTDQALKISGDDPRAPAVHALLDILLREVLEESEKSWLYADSIRYLLSLTVTRFVRANPDISVQPHDPTLSMLSGSLQYISDHISEKLTIDGIAETCGYSHEYYSRIFKHYYGVAPVRYITGVRLDKAIFLIRARHMTVHDAAMQSGYQSMAAFYKAFRSYFGCTPGEYMATSPEDASSARPAPRGIRGGKTKEAGQKTGE